MAGGGGELTCIHLFMFSGQCGILLALTVAMVMHRCNMTLGRSSRVPEELDES